MPPTLTAAGACNGCGKYSSCRFNKFKYYADHAHSAYRDTLVESRSGVNATVSTIRKLGELIKPLLEKGQSVYAILEAHPEIGLSEKTVYTYIETGVFREAGITINCLDLKKQVRRSPPKKLKFKPRRDLSYTKGRTSKEYDEYMAANPNARVVQMDTVYNDSTNGPFIQTFKFLRYDLLLCLYHEEKTALDMLACSSVIRWLHGRKDRSKTFISFFGKSVPKAAILRQSVSLTSMHAISSLKTSTRTQKKS